MFEFPNGGILVEDVSELPNVPKEISTLFLDFETSSNDPNETSLNPWKRKNCTVLGAALTWDDCPRAWYVLRKVLDQCKCRFLSDALKNSLEWCNHNIKYDVHVARNDLNLEYSGELVCTQARAHVYDADRTFKGGYSLGALSKYLLDHDISEYEFNLQPFLPKKGKLKNKDYGRIKNDIIGEYACQDALTTRNLKLFLDENVPTDCNWVIENETKLTSALIAMEQRGLQISRPQIKLQNYLAIGRMLEILDKLEKHLGKKFLPTSYPDMYDLLINEFQFPKIEKEDAVKDASFDRAALLTYYELPGYEKHRDLINLISEYRSLDTHKGLYWEAWDQLADENDILHSDTNQNVRSGRTSQKQPNGQQLDGLAKSQILARDGYTFLCYDHSQLEYRWMMHYLGNEKAIKAYNENPDTDYHEWVARVLCKGLIKRKPAKTLNFAIGFGMGQDKTTKRLGLVPDVIEACDRDPIRIKSFVTTLLSEYHRNLPELKKHRGWAENTARKQGYVRTLYGRRLHLPKDFSYKGFNRVVQSTAADASKEGIIASSPVFNNRLHELDVHLLAIVHDEFLYEVPDDPGIIQEANEEILRCLSLPSLRCKVPIIANGGEPAKNWRDAKGD